MEAVFVNILSHGNGKAVQGDPWTKGIIVQWNADSGSFEAYGAWKERCSSSPGRLQREIKLALYRYAWCERRGEEKQEQSVECGWKERAGKRAPQPGGGSRKRLNKGGDAARGAKWRTWFPLHIRCKGGLGKVLGRDQMKSLFWKNESRWIWGAEIYLSYANMVIKA